MPKMSFTDFLPAGAYRLRRAAVMTVGVLFMGFAVAALVLADLGTDPFTTACLAFAARMGWLLGSAELLINAVMFCLVLWQDPHRIGLGTLANMVLVGYTADFFGWVFRLYGITAPTGGAARFVFMVAALAVFVVAASLYMTADLGTAPYDAMSFVLAATLPHLPFRAVRMAWDAAWVVLTLVLGGSVGPPWTLWVVGQNARSTAAETLVLARGARYSRYNNVIKGVLAYDTAYFLDR